MALTKSYLSLLKYIQEKKHISIEELSNKFHKNNSTIRREIDQLNLYLSDQEQILIQNGNILSYLDYDQYLSFINRLSILDYNPNQIERFHLIIIKSFIMSFVNTSHLYESLSLSLTTKKNDLKKLRLYLKEKELDLVILHKKGIKIIGDELRYRILIIKILLPLIEINTDYVLSKRKANTPFDNLIVDVFYNEYQSIMEYCQKYVIEFLQEYHLHTTYSSKKFLLLYTAISNIRKKHTPTFIKQDISLTPLNLYFFEDADENKAFNHVIALLDFQQPLDFPENSILKQQCIHFIDNIQNNIITHLYTKDIIHLEIYQYLYKSIISIHHDFFFQDKMIRDTALQFSSLYKNIQIALHDIEAYFGITFNEYHTTTLTLLMRKWINKNKILGRNNKKVIIVTNTSYERISYFIEYMKDIIELKFVSILNINEVDLIKTMDFDWIFTFSDRVQSIIESLNYPSIQLNFFINDSDIEKLLKTGFSRKHHKLLASSFAKIISNQSKEDLIKILKDDDNDFFL